MWLSPAHQPGAQAAHGEEMGATKEQSEIPALSQVVHAHQSHRSHLGPQGNCSETSQDTLQSKTGASQGPTWLPLPHPPLQGLAGNLSHHHLLPPCPQSGHSPHLASSKQYLKTLLCDTFPTSAEHPKFCVTLRPPTQCKHGFANSHANK